MKTKIGLDLFPNCWPEEFKNSNIGLVCHAASVNSKSEHIINLFNEHLPNQLKAIFGPQHGLFGETQDNMIEWENSDNKKNTVQIHSLYGKNRHPKKEWLQDIDVMVFDLVDVGARYYTFIWTMFLCLRECESLGIPVIIFDRPNPIGRKSEGSVLDSDYTSFVGLYPLPIRHGFTIAEVAKYFVSSKYKKVDLHIIKMENYNANSFINTSNSNWIPPSPNIPIFDTTIVYPGMCLLEGTNLNEGRGTTRPFETFGAPFIDNMILKKELDSLNLPGISFRPIKYIPTFHKFSDVLCEGLFLHVTDKEIFKPFITAIAILNIINKLWPNDFKWNLPPYEYEEKILPIDVLFGNSWVRKAIENNDSIKDIEIKLNKELDKFYKDLDSSVYLY